MKLIKQGLTVKELLIAVAILVIIFSLKPTHFPDHRGSLEEGKKKACFSNLRLLEKAVEQYNKDNKIKMKVLNQDSLINGKYLKERIIDGYPDKKCKYLSEGDISTDGYIFCEYHGGVSQLYK